MDDYSDIISHPHHVSKKRRPMPMENRAAQFAPFAALTGYEEAVSETARLTENRRVLSEDALAALDAALHRLLAAGSGQAVRVRYFQPDDKKSGGSYCTVQGEFRFLDTERRCLCLKEGSRIPLKEIVQLTLL